MQLLAALGVVPAPERPVPLVESDDVLDALERSPRTSTACAREFVPQRRSIERVGGTSVRVQSRARPARYASLGPRADEHVVVQMRFTVTIDAVGESRQPAPVRRRVAVLAPARSRTTSARSSR